MSVIFVCSSFRGFHWISVWQIFAMEEPTQCTQCISSSAASSLIFADEIVSFVIIFRLCKWRRPTKSYSFISFHFPSFRQHFICTWAKHLENWFRIRYFSCKILCRQLKVDSLSWHIFLILIHVRIKLFQRNASWRQCCLFTSTKTNAFVFDSPTRSFSFWIRMRGTRGKQQKRKLETCRTQFSIFEFLLFCYRRQPPRDLAPRLTYAFDL